MRSKYIKNRRLRLRRANPCNAITNRFTSGDRQRDVRQELHANWILIHYRYDELTWDFYA